MIVGYGQRIAQDSQHLSVQSSHATNDREARIQHLIDLGWKRNQIEEFIH
jgi:hypothetical protein